MAKLKLAEREIPVTIYVEPRTNARVSIGKSGLSIRLPDFLSHTEQATQVESFYRWALGKYSQKPELLEYQLGSNKYESGYTFVLQGRQFTLEITDNPTATGKAKILNDIVYISIPAGMELAERQKMIAQLISRAIAKKYYQPIYNQLLYLNQLYFGKTIINFRLKYTHSVWGSCSRKGNINISTRLLFAPPDVIDYVLIHELAHLVHPNHSQDFWDEVARCMPDYKLKTKWLRKYGAQCDF